MAKDRRYYAKFTLDFPSHPKILPLSDAAFRTLIEATIWSCEHKTDGWLPHALALARWLLASMQELSTNDPQNPSLIASEAGWLIRDFAEKPDSPTHPAHAPSSPPPSTAKSAAAKNSLKTKHQRSSTHSKTPPTLTQTGWGETRARLSN